MFKEVLQSGAGGLNGSLDSQFSSSSKFHLDTGIEFSAKRSAKFVLLRYALGSNDHQDPEQTFNKDLLPSDFGSSRHIDETRPEFLEVIRRPVKIDISITSS